ncbi:MAG: isoprenylcysteine carboxylmethyltransferase family protein [bacterium]|nr:isoprenylcysteine carboxylmethyltransferase family protein [bacterium]
MTTRETLLKPAVWGFYILVVLEFLFMISPAALHFYAGYGPVLNFFHVSPWTSWLTGFYLPHISETGNLMLDTLRPAGLLLIASGLLLFVAGAIQIYGAKLFRRGAVTGGLYRWVRHPQYSALAVLGLGTVFIWPRFLVLLSFVSMLFLYYLLARWEEHLCLAKYGDSYRAYLATTGMLLPAPLGKWLREPDAEQTLRWPIVLVSYVMTIVVCTLLGFSVQTLSLRAVSSLYVGNAAVLSPAVLPIQEIETAYHLAMSHPELQNRLSDLDSDCKLLVYVVPANWFLPDLPLHTEDEIRRIGGGHGTQDFDHRTFKVLFTRVRIHQQDAEGPEIVRRAYGRDPILIVEVDLDFNQVLGHKEAPDHLIWGDIPTPMF